jgi:hypothetical protein
MTDKSWLDFQRFFNKYKETDIHNPLCIGIKVDLSMRELVFNTLKHLQKTGCMITGYYLESRGKLSGLQWNKSSMQGLWENFGLVNEQQSTIYREKIFDMLESSYNGEIPEGAEEVIRELSKPISTERFEEMLFADFISRTGDLPKVMHIYIQTGESTLFLVASHHQGLGRFGLSTSDCAILYCIDPFFNSKQSLDLPRLSDLQKQVLDLQEIFHARLQIYANYELTGRISIKDDWFFLKQ